MNSQIANAAKQYPEFEVVFQDAAQDNAKQVSDVENLLTQGIDLLIISPNEAAPLNDIVKQAWDACVPVIVLDRNLVDPNYSMFIGADNVAIGRGAGQYAAKWCKENNRTECKIAEIRGLEGAPPAKDRGDGFRMGLEDEGLSEKNIIFSQNADWLRERAVPAAAAAFQSNPDIDVLYGHNDPMAEGAYIAAQDAGIDVSKVLFIGIDGLPTPDGGIMSVLEGRIGVTFVYPTGGRQAIEWARLILEQHVNPPLWLVLPFDEINPSNAQDICNTFQCPNAQAAAPSEVVVTIQNFAFDPTPLTIPVGTTVRFVNKDSTAHSVTADDGSFDSGTLANGQEFTFKFDTAGTYPYYCKFHGGKGGQGMSGTITVQ
jgi:ribose transport system substrate-binding protein